MPNTTDNQDYKQDDQNEKSGANENVKEGAQSDINKFTSDNQKGKKIDADPEKETDKPADV